MTTPNYIGSTFALYGGSGSGKTTQIGEYAKYVARMRKKRTLLYSCDRGGFASIQPLVDAGIIIARVYTPEQDPWIWLNEAIKAENVGEDIGLIAYDSGTSMGEVLLTAASQSQMKMGQQATQRFTVSQGNGKERKALQVSLNNMAHYGLVQEFWQHQQRVGSYLINKGVDILWTFLEQRSESQDLTNVLGPKLVGKALTASLPKEFNYTFRLEAVPQDNDGAPLHRLYLKQHQEFGGLGKAFANARYPFDADTPLPTFVEPADMGVALALLEQGQAESASKAAALNAQLGLV
jgi:hypothetical protein